MKILLKIFNNILKLAEERISKLRDISIIDHGMERNKQSLREMWDTIQCTNICKIIQKQEERGEME